MSKIALILTEGFADWEYALIAGTGGAFYGLDIRFFATETGEVRSQGGLTALVSHRLEEIAAWSPTVIVVVGGVIWDSAEAPDIGELLKTHHIEGGVVAGICGGTLALARAGLLNNTPHTSNDAEFLEKNAVGYSGFKQYRESASAVSADRIITAPGVAPVTFTAAVFAGAGAEEGAIMQLKSMLSAEHVATLELAEKQS